MTPKVMAFLSEAKLVKIKAVPRSTPTWGPRSSFPPPGVRGGGGGGGGKQTSRESLSVCTPEHTQAAGPFPACTARLGDLLFPRREWGVLLPIHDLG